jgi:hypothetical protein
MEILLALCLALANGARGNGISGGKFFMPIGMALAAYTIKQDIWYAVLCPIPLLVFWWQPDGTGLWHKPVIKWLSFLPIKNEAMRWRVFEVASVFIYTVIYFYL